MAKLERPKGYSRKLWKNLTNQIRNIKRFVKEKTQTGVDLKKVPDIKDVFTKKGRKAIRDWSAKKQWENAEYVDTETGEILTGKEAKKQWSADRKREREESEKPQDAPEFDIYDEILERLQVIPNERIFGFGNKAHVVNTGGLRDMLITKLKDYADDVGYLYANEAEISANIVIVAYDSKQYNVEVASTKLLTIFNGGGLSSQDWNNVQGIEDWSGYSGEDDIGKMRYWEKGYWNEM